MKTNLEGYKPAGYRLAYHPRHGLANLTEQDYKELVQTTRKERERKYNYWRGFLVASLLLGIPFVVILFMCNNLINVIVK